MKRATKKKPTARELRAARQQAEAQNDPRFRDGAGFALKPAVSTFTPKTDNQRLALQLLDEGTPIVLLTGSAGTGKSMLAAYRAAMRLKTKSIQQVILMRPAVVTGPTIGLLPGEADEKLAPYFRQTLKHLSKFLGKDMQYALENKQIEMFPGEYARGNSFENCLVIAEEAQNYTHEEFEMMFTRLGENCQMVFTGDTKQHDLKGDSGLKTTMALIDKMREYQPFYLNDDDMDQIDNGIGIVEFQPEDVVRSGLTRALVKMYFHNGG
jgi:phosphate starvation-inducible protein PhoH and related proteins